jgi:hypothetical protein
MKSFLIVICIPWLFQPSHYSRTKPVKPRQPPAATGTFTNRGVRLHRSTVNVGGNDNLNIIETWNQQGYQQGKQQ